jgi:hypothetical protein
MAKQYVVVVCLLVGLLFFDLGLEAQPRDALKSFISLLEAWKIGTVEVFGIPRAAETPQRMTPAALNESWSYKTTIREFNIFSRDDLLKTLKGAVISPGEGPLDMRWGVVFRSKQGEVPYLHLYFDSRGTRGYINDTPVRFNDGFSTGVMHAITLSTGP